MPAAQGCDGTTGQTGTKSDLVITGLIANPESSRTGSRTGRSLVLPNSVCTRGSARSSRPRRGLKETGLLQLTSIYMAKLCASSPKVMRCEVIQSQTLSTLSNHIPNDVLGDAGAPGSSVTTDSSKDSSRTHRCSCQPPVYGTLHPDRHGTVRT
jgi:hypothetical protein